MMITNLELEELEADQRRSKNRPDRRRRRVISAVERLRGAEAILRDFALVMDAVGKLPGDPGMRVGAFSEELMELGERAKYHKKNVGDPVI